MKSSFFEEKTVNYYHELFEKGHERLVEALAKLYSQFVNREIDPSSEILITCGAYEALYTSIQGLVILFCSSKEKVYKSKKDGRNFIKNIISTVS